MVSTSFDRFGWGQTGSLVSNAGGGPGTQLPYIIYVSSSGGNDSNNGLSPATPKLTLAAGKALMRSGMEDQLLLKWGDTWTEALGNWTTSGRSLRFPQKIGHYQNSLSGARPKVRSGTSDGLVFSGPVQFVTVENIWITPHSYTGASGAPSAIKIAETGSYITIQGCYLSNCSDGVRADPPVTAGHTVQHLTVFRNVFADIYAAVGNPAHGVYCARTYNSTINDNVFSKIGEVDPGIQHYGVLVRSGYSYNCNNVRVDGNLFLEVAGTAVLNRSTFFQCNNNMVSRAAVSFGMNGLDPVNGNVQEGIVEAYVNNNCITEPRDTNGSTARGWGFSFEHCGSPFEPTSVSWHNNILVGPGTATDLHPFIVWPTYPPASGLSMQHLLTNGNRVYEWRGSFKINESATADPFRTNSFDNAKVYSTGSHYVFEHNLDSGSRWNVGDCHLLSGAASGLRYRYNGSNETQATWKTHIGGGAPGTDEAVAAGDFPDTTRTIATYDTVVGGVGTFADFVALVRTQALGNWRPELGGAAVALWIHDGYWS